MKISSIECGNAAASATESRVDEKILPKNMPRKSARTHMTPLEQGIAVAQDALRDIPDIREDIVNNLKERIANGDYKVSGEDVADMMMRRRAADRIR
ncbi:MAG: flagellar biosynthesis anti-sigma factor FlgM [Armatimonadota bacterium]